MIVGRTNGTNVFCIYYTLFFTLLHYLRYFNLQILKPNLCHGYEQDLKNLQTQVIVKTIDQKPFPFWKIIKVFVSLFGVIASNWLDLLCCCLGDHIWWCSNTGIATEHFDITSIPVPPTTPWLTVLYTEKPSTSDFEKEITSIGWSKIFADEKTRLGCLLQITSINH